MAVNKTNYYTVMGFMLEDLHLSGTELNVYAIIYGFSQGANGKFTGSASYLAEWTGTTRRTVMNCLASLKEKGLIIADEIEVNGVKYVKYYANIKALQTDVVNFIGCEKISQGYEEISQGGMKNFHRGCEKISHNNINNTIDNNISNNIDNPLPPKRGKQTIKDTNLDTLTTLLHDYDFSQQIEAKLVEWYSYKAEQKKKITPIGMKSQLTKVDNMIKSIGEDSVIYVLDESMANNYQGMIWDLAKKGKQQAKPKSLFDEWGVE